MSKEQASKQTKNEYGSARRSIAERQGTMAVPPWPVRKEDMAPIGDRASKPTGYNPVPEDGTPATN